MYVKAVTSTIVDTNLLTTPFKPSYKVLVVNLATSANSLQSSDSDSGFSELASLPASSITSVTLDKQYIKVPTGTVYMISD